MWSPTPSPATNLPFAIRSQRPERGDENDIRQQADSGNERADRHPVGYSSDRTEQWHGAQSGSVGSTDRPQVIEDEHPVQPEPLGEDRGVDRMTRPRETTAGSPLFARVDHFRAACRRRASEGRHRRAPASSPSAARTIAT